MLVSVLNVSFKTGETGEAGWREYFTDVVPRFNNAVEVRSLECT